MNGTYTKNSKVVEMPAIVDKVLIPKDLAPGPYVVSWRWVGRCLIDLLLSSSCLTIPCLSPRSVCLEGL